MNSHYDEEEQNSLEFQKLIEENQRKHDAAIREMVREWCAANPMRIPESGTVIGEIAANKKQRVTIPDSEIPFNKKPQLRG